MYAIRSYYASLAAHDLATPLDGLGLHAHQGAGLLQVELKPKVAVRLHAHFLPFAQCREVLVHQLIAANFFQATLHNLNSLVTIADFFQAESVNAPQHRLFAGQRHGLVEGLSYNFV